MILDRHTAQPTRTSFVSGEVRSPKPEAGHTVAGFWIRIFTLGLTAALWLAIVPPAPAQELERANPARDLQRIGAIRGGILPADDWTDGKQVTAVFAPVVEKARQATVRVMVNGKHAVLGTVVSPGGLIVSKASELTGESLAVVLHDGRTFRAKVLSRDEQTDLALMQVGAGDLAAVEWASRGESPQWGQWVAAPWAVVKRVQVGVISAVTRKIPRQGGAIGIDLGDEGELHGGVVIAGIVPDSGASEAGLEPGDVVTHIEGRATATKQQLINAVSQYPPGQTLILTVRRGRELSDFAVTLRERRKLFGDTDKPPLIGETSERRDGFELVLQHHIPLAPSNCGGPLVNLDGKVVGINIARVTRNEAYALPSDVVLKTIDRLIQDAGLQRVTNPAATTQ